MSGGDILFKTDNTTRVFVDRGGSIGIGTATPQKTLHIEHTGGASEGILISGASDTNGHTAGILLRAEGGEANSALRAKGAIFFERTDTYGIGKLHLCNNNSANNNSAALADARLTIDGGNVGIGETNPGNLLHVKVSDTGIAPHTSAQIALEREGTNYLQFLTAETGTSGILFGDGSDVDVSGVVCDHNVAKMYLRSETNDVITIDGTNERVGINDSSPDYSLHVNSGTTNVAAKFESTDASAGIMLLDTGGNVELTAVGDDFHVQPAGGTAKLVVKSTGYAEFAGASDLRVTFGSQGTAGNNDSNWIRGNAATLGYNTDSGDHIWEVGGSEKMRLDSDGKFIVDSTGNPLNSGGAVGSFVFAGGQGVFISTVAQSTGEVMGFVHQRTSAVGTIAIDSSSTTYNTSSDARLKNVLGDAKGLEIVNQLNPVNFEWKESKKVQDGLIAQEVEELVPNAVSEGSSGYYQMDYSKLVTPLIKAVQEQQEQIEELKARIATLEE